TEPETEPPKPFTERLADLQNYTGTAVVVDENSHLDEESTARFQNTLQALSDSYEICTALVITDHLSGIEPERFAEKYYRALFNGADGFLMLVNNDTGTDLCYTAGAVTVEGTDMRIAQATPHLVEKDYPAAIDILLPAGEDILIAPPTEAPELPETELPDTAE
ncbi:MAG: TPM domain-containing protein, partial [Oscillospiraceae bacterium]|nr:TPM domain-containing protein [Oscillospiraceae bacterium]